MFKTTKTLDGILKTFTKTKTDLEAYITEQQTLQGQITEKVAALEVDRVTAYDNEAKATKTLDKIKEILG